MLIKIPIKTRIEIGLSYSKFRPTFPTIEIEFESNFFPPAKFPSFHQSIHFQSRNRKLLLGWDESIDRRCSRRIERRIEAVRRKNLSCHPRAQVRKGRPYDRLRGRRTQPDPPSSRRCSRRKRRRQALHPRAAPPSSSSSSLAGCCRCCRSERRTVQRPLCYKETEITDGVPINGGEGGGGEGRGSRRAWDAGREGGGGGSIRFLPLSRREMDKDSWIEA